MQTVLITGGTGMIGRQLSKQLVAKGYRVIILTRETKNKENNNFISYAAWDVKKQTIDAAALEAADIIVHLAGAGVVDKRWTKAYKKEIVESRTSSSRLLIDALKNTRHKVKTIVSASAIGWYGADKKPGHFFVETDEAANDFLGQTCLLWEQSIEPAEQLGIRVCKLRTGIVLSNDGGALAEFKKPVKAGIAAILSSGSQMISWIHAEDLCRLYIHAIEHENISGSYNAVAPRPVSNKQLTLSLAKILKGNAFLAVHVPKFVLKLMMGESSVEVLKSTTVSCEKVKASGFTFLFPSLDAALQELLKK